MYHFVCPTKYRRAVITIEIDQALVEICSQIAQRYEIEFLEIGADNDHVHFLVQSVPTYSPTRVIRIIKSLTARELFARFPGLRKLLWGGSFWSGGFFVTTVGRYGGEQTMRRYVQDQGFKDYQRLCESQPSLFEADDTDDAG